MLLSMTGFGAATGGVDGVDYTVEVRTVNNRYCKINTKLPDCWSGIEPEVEQRIRTRLTRGSVTLAVRMKVPEEKAAYQVNTGLLQRYVDQLKVLEAGGDPAFRIDLAAMLQLPGVCEPPPLEELVAETKDQLLALVDRALEALVAMRKAEGQALVDDLLAHCSQIEAKLAAISERAPLVIQEYHERLSARVKQLTEQARLQIDQEALGREVAIFAERSDIAEEISRLTGHVEQFRQTVDAPEPSGRKLDFIAQEMLREANTIASKAGDTDIGRAVVDIKTAIDRIKEQVQNAE